MLEPSKPQMPGLLAVGDDLGLAAQQRRRLGPVDPDVLGLVRHVHSLSLLGCRLRRIHRSGDRSDAASAAGRPAGLSKRATYHRAPSGRRDDGPGTGTADDVGTDAPLSQGPVSRPFPDCEQRMNRRRLRHRSRMGHARPGPVQNAQASDVDTLEFMAHVRVAACQINTVVGDLDGNAARILDALATAERGGADLAVFPELAVTGYPPEDLLDRPAFVVDNQAHLRPGRRGHRRLCGGHRLRRHRHVGAPDQLGGALCAGGHVLAEYAKRLLPNYGVFDEQRWFAPGDGARPPFPGGRRAGRGDDLRGHVVRPAARWASRRRPVPGCSSTSTPRPIRAAGATRAPGRAGERVAETGCAIVYVNQVGGQDELVFDGASMVVGRDGALLAEAPPIRGGRALL